MTDPALLQRLADLRKQIHFHNYRYHTLDQPLISDYEFDQLLNELKARGYPELDLRFAHPAQRCPTFER